MQMIRNFETQKGRADWCTGDVFTDAVAVCEPEPGRRTDQPGV
jgi:hypothetical protein